MSITQIENENISDLKLVQLSLEDKENFYYLMKRYESKMLRYIKRLTDVSPEEAEDILQDIFIKLYRNLNGFNPHLKFSSWIYRIAHNEIINHYYKNKSRLQTTHMNLDCDDVQYSNETIRNGDEIFIQLILHETAACIRKVLATLPQKYREVLILRYLEEKKYDEIGDILRKPSGTVATLLNRAKSRFKKAALRLNLMVTYE